MPEPLGLGGQPTSVCVGETRVNLRSVGPSAQSNATALLPIGLAALKARELFSSDAVGDEVTAPVPSSYSVTEKVLLVLPGDTLVPVQDSSPNLGVLNHEILNAFTFTNPSAITGKLVRSADLELGLRSAHAGAIFGTTVRNCGTPGVLEVSPFPNVMLPLEFQKNPFHTHDGQVAFTPVGPPNANSNPPCNRPPSGGLPAPSLSSPLKGVF